MFEICSRIRNLPESNFAIVNYRTVTRSDYFKRSWYYHFPSHWAVLFCDFIPFVHNPTTAFYGQYLHWLPSFACFCGYIYISVAFIAVIFRPGFTIVSHKRRRPLYKLKQNTKTRFRAWISGMEFQQYCNLYDINSQQNW